MPERDDAAERLLREALGPNWDFGRSDPKIASMDELTELIHSLNLPGPVKPSDEDFDDRRGLPANANNALQAHYYRLAQAKALIRLAKEEKVRRLSAGEHS